VKTVKVTRVLSLIVFRVFADPSVTVRCRTTIIIKLYFKSQDFTLFLGAAMQKQKTQSYIYTI
jgi:hypothetical protein